MLVKQNHRNSHTIVLDKNQKHTKILLISDVHWDNPKCDRELLKRHLNQAMQEDCPIILNGDTFCLMQGRGDKRGSKSDVLPEHNNSKYLDSIVETAVDWWEPYAKNIAVIGYGNHECSVIKWQETDILQRFVSRLNERCKTSISLGGYGGWVIVRFDVNGKVQNYRIKYFHGSGGGGPVTKGTIQHNRKATMISGADLIWMGHVHEDYEVTYMQEAISPNNHKPELRELIMLRTSTYKEEYGDNHHGWHNERGAPPKPLGGRWLEIDCDIPPSRNGKHNLKLHAKTYKTKQ